jgi:peptidoglycan/xylan/chitin deacetylase (PgdA/CDA1 family)
MAKATDGTRKRILLKAYYGVTGWARAWYQRRLAVAGRAPISVLTFHRVADDAANRWTTRTRDFVEVIRWLKPRFDLISLEELQRRVREGNRRPSVCITFDDGYADNCNLALPLLFEEGIPCAYFVAAGGALEGRPFDHDIRMGNRRLAPNSIAQLRELSRLGIEIGFHTRTHANLGAIADRDRLIDEVVTSCKELEAALGQRIRYFAFPFGAFEDLSVEALDLARTAGYAGICSAYGGWNSPGDDPFHIRRHCVDGLPCRSKDRAIIDPVRERRLRRLAYT